MALETQNIEWKRTWRDEYLKWICGFANAQGGVLEIGKDDKGRVVGVEDVLRLLEEIPGKVRDLLGILVDVNLRSDADCEYIEIVVRPHSNPISYRGEFHYRSGNTKQILRGAALSHFLLERHGKTWDDVALPGVGLKNLDVGAVERFRQRATDSARLPAEVVGEPIGTTMENLNLRDGAHLTRAAALLFHPYPGRFLPEAHVKIGYFRGSEVLFHDVIDGNLFHQVDRTMDLLYTKYTLALVSYESVYRVDAHPVPHEAMREAVINAVIHRDYVSATPIQIRVYADRISIWNAAHLTPEWAASQLAGNLASRPHNPKIAYVFFRAGMIEAWGRGIQRIIDLCKGAGNPIPTWRLDLGGDGLRVLFPFSDAYLAAKAEMRGRDSESTTQKTTQKTTQVTGRIAKSAVERILACLGAEPTLSRREIAEMVGLTPDGVKYHLRRLKAAGRIQRVGPDRGGHWRVLR